MILIHGQPPPFPTLEFFDLLLPGFWKHWAASAVGALSEIDQGNVGETILTSWFRTLLENRRVGGHPDSQHLVGLAFDVVPGKGTGPLAINEAAQIFERFGFTVEPAEKHVHVQTFPPNILRPAGVLDALSV